MAKEKWTVFYGIEDQGAQFAFNWKEKDIVTKAGEKNAGLSSGTSILETGPSGQRILNTGKNQTILEPSPLITNAPSKARFVTIEAEGAEEAAQAVRMFLGASGGSNVNGKFLACATTNLTEAVAEP